MIFFKDFQIFRLYFHFIFLRIIFMCYRLWKLDLKRRRWQREWTNVCYDDSIYFNRIFNYLDCKVWHFWLRFNIRQTDSYLCQAVQQHLLMLFEVWFSQKSIPLKNSRLIFCFHKRNLLLNSVKFIYQTSYIKCVKLPNDNIRNIILILLCFFKWNKNFTFVSYSKTWKLFKTDTKSLNK